MVWYHLGYPLEVTCKSIKLEKYDLSKRIALKVKLNNGRGILQNAERRMQNAERRTQNDGQRYRV